MSMSITSTEHPVGTPNPGHNRLRTSVLARALVLWIAILWPPGHSSAQLIQVKTVPVASGDQFLLFPSGNLAMGGVRLALPDTTGDLFSSPGAGGRLSESVLFGSPTFYSVSDDNGSGRSLPIGGLFTGGNWYGGGALTLQELTGGRREEAWPVFLDVAPWSSLSWPWPGQDLSEASSRNLYAFGLVGFRVPGSGVSVGLSGSYADLGAMDGVELLYAQAREIRQSGHISDLRLGVLKEWEDDRALEVVLLRNTVRMRHEVTYLNLIWAPVPPDPAPMPQWDTRLEENLDHTDTWGGQVAYRRPLGGQGWSVGWALAVNRKDHPKIPNYEIQNIPRDPGDTWAYSAGVGVARVDGPLRLGADLFLQPILSDTWADAAVDTVDVQGHPIPAGEKTVENEFLFTNILINMGASWQYRSATFLAGVRARSISYELDQFDRIELTKRNQDESWMEWSPSFGLDLDLSGVNLRWVTRVTTGTGRPGVRWTGARVDEASGGVPSSDFILAPSGPLTLQDARVTTHQISVIIPMR